MAASRPIGAGPGLRSRVREDRAARRDAVLMEAGATGELLAARVRILLLGILLVIQFLPGTEAETRLVTLPLNIVALVVAALLLSLASRLPRPWLEGFASTAADVTLVSCGLAAFLLLDQPHIAVNSRTLFEVYFLAIGCAGLRYNPQVCALAGLLAVGQYGAIVLYAAARWNLNDPRYAPFAYGMFDWGTQGMRLIALAAAAVVSAFIVQRARGLRHLSATDRLTGAANRRAFDERLAAEASRARRHSRPFAVALIDIDDFKRINDTCGHAGGDAVLRAVAGILRRSMRKSDLVARFGGDEFALLLPETTAEAVTGKLESLRDAVAATEIPARPTRRAAPLSVTVSIGLAGWPEDGGEADEVLACADGRLYEAKQRGRNQVVGPAQRTGPLPAAGPPEPVPPP